MASGRGETWLERAGATLETEPLVRARRYFTPRMKRMLLILGIFLILLFGWVRGVPWVFMTFFMDKDSFTQAQTVSTVHPQALMWQTQVRAVGTLHAVQGADLSSELAGIVDRIGFEAGDDVKKGQLLIQLRDDSDRAQLQALQANAEMMRQTYVRNSALAKSNAISPQAFDQANANMKNARAQADAQAAIVQKKAIRAPFSGRVGIRMVDVGQYVNAGTALVTLQQLDPIYVDFSAPQQQIAVLRPGDKVVLTTDAVAGQTFQGSILALDPKVDPVTRNVRVRAQVGNPDKKLIPGMFASVIADVGDGRRQLTLPQTAITYNPYGDTVYVVLHRKNKKGEDQLYVEQRFVVLGETRGDQVAVVNGVSARDLVVSAGQMKLKNGAWVNVNNAIRMPNDPNPTPVQQ
jgi:membrane fusion protein (multidrug efflux system)